jgi:hypothetical protein
MVGQIYLLSFKIAIEIYFSFFLKFKYFSTPQEE